MDIVPFVPGFIRWGWGIVGSHARPSEVFEYRKNKKEKNTLKGVDNTRKSVIMYVNRRLMG